MSTAAVDWSAIDTVLLDMDGTLLDLRFDNWFWRELIPHRYAAANGISPAAAWQKIAPKLDAVRGTIEWYCIDHWSRELGLDIVGIKRVELEKIGYLPGAEDFLRSLKLSGKQRVLVTNAHPHTLDIKDKRVGLTVHFNAWFSSHPFGRPKEHPEFWPSLRSVMNFDPTRTLFVDDSVPVLDAARRFGIRWIRAIRYPDSDQGPQPTGNHVAVDRVRDLL